MNLLEKTKDKTDKEKKDGKPYLQRRKLSLHPEEWADIDLGGKDDADQDDIEVHVYETPEGVYGYEVVFWRTDKNGVRSTKRHHYGPEKRRDIDTGKWIEIDMSKLRYE